MELRANLVWTRDEPWFGGFSGAEVTADGQTITLISDRGTWVTARMQRTAGALTGLRDVTKSVLRDPMGRPLRNRFADAEGLATARDGTTYISFEGASRVTLLNTNTGQTRPLPRHPDFASFEINKGPEALAIHPDGTLYTLAEHTPHTAFALYAFRNGRWSITHALPARGPFLAVGADFDAQGRLYLLERALTPLGFRSRIRRFDLTAPELSEITLLTSGPGRFDNLEALSVWQDKTGTPMLTLISDDNFLSIQRTQIVEFALTE